MNVPNDDGAETFTRFAGIKVRHVTYRTMRAGSSWAGFIEHRHMNAYAFRSAATRRELLIALARDTAQIGRAA